MTARNHPRECPHYVPQLPGYVRVTLTAEGEPEEFRGEYLGEPLTVDVRGADAIRVRQAIRLHGSAIWDAIGAHVHGVDQDGRTWREADRVRVQLAFARGYSRAAGKFPER